MKTLKILAVTVLVAMLAVPIAQAAPQNIAGIAAVQKAAKEHPYQAQNEEAVDVENALNNYMEKRGWGNNFGGGNIRIFTIGTWDFKLRNPKRARGFLRDRSMAASMSQLITKVDIIKMIRTKMTASDQITMPGTDVYAKLNAEKIKLDDELDKMEEEAAELLEQVDEAKLEKLEGKDWDNKGKAFLDAIIKKIDESYDKDEVPKENAKKLESLKQNLSEVERKKKALMKEAEKLKGATQSETKSSIEAIAGMPLYGVMILATEESWDPESKMYEVGVLSVWSQKHEMKTRALLTSSKAGNKLEGTDKELRYWLGTKNLANMIGASNFTDSNGHRWIVGAAAREIRGGNKKVKVRQAKLWSSKEVAMALFSDVESHEKAETASKEVVTDAVTEETDTKAVETYNANMRAGFKNRKVAGLLFIKGQTIKHPFTGKKMYVAVSATSALANAAAFDIEKINYQANQEDIASQKYQKGLKEGYEQKRKEAEKDDSARRAGVEDASNSIKSAKPTRHRRKKADDVDDEVTRRSSEQGGATGAYSAGSRSEVKEDDF